MAKASPKQSAEQTAKLAASKRPFRTHYAGLNIGACRTIEGALIAAYAHIVRGEATKANVLGPDGNDRARLHWTSFGISTWCPPEVFARPAAVSAPSRAKLRRVA